MAKTSEARPADGGAPLRAEPKAEPAVKRKVSEHCAERYAPSKPGATHPELWKHAAAAAMHGWAQCAHHEAREMELTDADYSAAIDAGQVLSARGIPTPHKPALYGAEKGAR